MVIYSVIAARIVIYFNLCSHGKGQMLHLFRAETTLPINTKFVTIDYVGGIKRLDNFDCDRY